MYLRNIFTGLALSGLCFAANAATIDFETVPGETPVDGVAISNQFAATAGVTFALADGSAPVLASYGGTRTAFQGPGNGNDNLSASEMEDLGSFFLTDDGVTSGGLSDPVLIVTYLTPSQFASGSILDVDGGETFSITAFDSEVGGTALDSIHITAGDADTGNGIATNWIFERATADIRRIEFAGNRGNF
ncbi:MAG: hypothetical protein AAGJ89_06470, partial [Pseudomonadota bacterium]